jgi:hypothetical protein
MISSSLMLVELTGMNVSSILNNFSTEDEL